MEMQLAVIAVHHRECLWDDDFGRHVSDATCLDSDEGTQTLTNIAIYRCSIDEDYRKKWRKKLCFMLFRKYLKV